MKKALIFSIALLVVFAAQAQTSIKLKEGAKLVYEVEDGGNNYKLSVTVEGLSPLQVSYKTSNGNYNGTIKNTAKNQDEFDYKFYMPTGLVHPGPMLLWPKTAFVEMQKIDKDFHDGMDVSKSAVKVTFTGTTTPETLTNLTFQNEDIVADTKDISLTTYAMMGEFVILRVNTDVKTPLVTYLNDGKGFSIHLTEVSGVDVYTLEEK